MSRRGLAALVLGAFLHSNVQALNVPKNLTEEDMTYHYASQAEGVASRVLEEKYKDGNLVRYVVETEQFPKLVLTYFFGKNLTVEKAYAFNKNGKLTDFFRTVYDSEGRKTEEIEDVGADGVADRVTKCSVHNGEILHQIVHESKAGKGSDDFYVDEMPEPYQELSESALEQLNKRLNASLKQGESREIVSSLLNGLLNKK